MPEAEDSSPLSYSSWWRPMCRLVFALLHVQLVLSTCVAAQVADTLRSGRDIARFTEARALAVDPQGRIYVVDAGRSMVAQFAPDGRLLATLGGPGADEGAFYDPRDIDPTNGLVLVVADAGNSRLQRFSNRFLPLESLPVGRTGRQAQGQGSQPVYHLGENSKSLEGDGRPIAVVTNAANETFAIDAAQGLVLKWDQGRRFERHIGGFDAAEGALQEPVALAIDEAYLYVADRGAQATAVYDHLGGFVRWIAQTPDVQALTIDGEALWVVQPYQLSIFTKLGRWLETRAVELGEPLVDAQPLAGELLLLTASRLVSTP